MVLHIYTPTWFYGFDSIFEVVAVIVGILIAYFAYKTYKYTSERRYLHFSGAFFLVAAAFLTNILTYTIFYYGRPISDSNQIAGEAYWYLYSRFAGITNIGNFISITLMLFAFLIMFLSVYNIKDKVINFLFVYFIIISVLYSKHSFIFFHGTLLVLTSLIFANYYKKYLEKKTRNRGFVASSFFIMAASQLFFVIGAFSGIIFVTAHTVQLLGYLVLLVTIIQVLKK